MSEYSIIKNCSPTLAGIKTGNLFCVTYQNDNEKTEVLRKWNKMFLKKGLRVVPFENKYGGELVYIYRISRLSEDLSQTAARRILTERGYCPDCLSCPEKCVAALSKRIKSGGEFPHEIGIFLGYPPEDVRGFIEKRKCKFTGCRKVYGDVAAAKKQFSQYKKCTEIYSRLYFNGRSIEQLTVSG